MPKFINSGPFTSEPSTTQGSYIQITNALPNIPVMQSMNEGLRLSRGQLTDVRSSSGNKYAM